MYNMSLATIYCISREHGILWQIILPQNGKKKLCCNKVLWHLTISLQGTLFLNLGSVWGCLNQECTLEGMPGALWGGVICGIWFLLTLCHWIQASHWTEAQETIQQAFWRVQGIEELIQSSQHKAPALQVNELSEGYLTAFNQPVEAHS